MVENTTIEVAEQKQTENYVVYESADGDTIVGFYVSDGAAEQVGQFASVTLAEAGEAGVTLEKKKDTGNYGTYQTAGGAISGIYISHDELESDESDEGEPAAPDEIDMTISPSDEETFEDAIPSQEEEEEALVEDADSDDSDEEEVTQEDEEEELVVADDELGL